MVYYKTNWIRDSNQWVMRKVRPVSKIENNFKLIVLQFAWGAGLGMLYFHMTLYEHLNRRVALWNKWFDIRTDEEKQHDAERLRS